MSTLLNTLELLPVMTWSVFLVYYETQWAVILLTRMCNMPFGSAAMNSASGLIQTYSFGITHPIMIASMRACVQNLVKDKAHLLEILAIRGLGSLSSQQVYWDHDELPYLNQEQDQHE